MTEHRGSNPFTFTVRRDSAEFLLRAQQYLLLQPLNASATLCSYQLAMNYHHNTSVEVLHDSQYYAASTPAVPSLTSYAVWVPSETTGALQSIQLTFTNVSYHWTHNHTVATPLSVYCGYSTTLQQLDVASSTAVISTASFFYEPTFTITLQRSAIETFLLVAIESQGSRSPLHSLPGTVSFNLSSSLVFSPFLLTPSTPIKGSFSTYHDTFNSYIFFYAPQYTPFTLSVSKQSTDYRSLSVRSLSLTSSALLVAIDHYPTYDDYDWMEQKAASTEPLTLNITLSRNHPKFCNKCDHHSLVSLTGKYYITVYMEHAVVQSTNATQILLAYVCPNDQCSDCPEGKDPATQCQDCLSDFYGSNCNPCGDCHRGTCNDGLVGDGSCVCETGFTSYSNCTDCKSGYYGSDCTECPSCNGNGSCNDGLSGDGSCTCVNFFDPATSCSDCRAGYFGTSCVDACPRSDAAVCSEHGVCDDGIDGLGRCSCEEGYVGLSGDCVVR